MRNFKAFHEFLVFATVFVAAFATGKSAHAQASAVLQVDWGQSLGVNKTIPSLQVVTGPELRVGNPLHDPNWNALKNLGADNVRFAAWLEYPKLSVAELDPPVGKRRSWNTEFMDPIVLDYFNATAGHARLANFSVTPQWLWVTSSPIKYPTDPNTLTRTYQQGTQLHTGGVNEIAAYYKRLVSWYTLGGFTDDDGSFHASGFHYKIDTWEILNEVDVAKEHNLGPGHYNLIYDAVVAAIRQVQPNMQFMGPALGSAADANTYAKYFLNPAAHAAGTPVNWMSYHFYGSSQSGSPFSQADAFFKIVAKNEAYKKTLNASVKTAIDEIGVLDSSDASKIGPLFWNLSAANYAYVYGHLAVLGIDLACMSELSTDRYYPSVGMVDAKTGLPNARYWVLKTIKDKVGVGDTMASTHSSLASIYAQAFVSPRGQRKILVVNQSRTPVNVSLSGASALTATAVSSKAVNLPPVQLAGSQIALDAYGVAVVNVP